MMLLFLCIFVVKGLSQTKLKGYVFSLFNKGFVEIETEENNGFFNSFYILLFLFSIITISFTAYYFKTRMFLAEHGFANFLNIFYTLFIYFSLKWILEYLLSVLFLIKNQVRFFLISKSCYLISVSFFLFFGIILSQYSNISSTFLFYFAGFLFAIRFVLHLTYNKNLIFNQLFYFILYICAFEIAPLFLLFKLLF
ncbi:DUF4271 domain-containing protein [uncultured Polaribacter sp.]|uniref:DUF4271 domain-containing protein n=1 Tax=uncultured Polaribacter sp. TaxID=174711 RepID=UPI0026029665|nr:DUF4271 domain-containing protein [uncultured Polaribacter sp.]